MPEADEDASKKQGKLQVGRYLHTCTVRFNVTVVGFPCTCLGTYEEVGHGLAVYNNYLGITGIVLLQHVNWLMQATDLRFGGV